MAAVWPCAMTVEQYARVGRAVRVPGLGCPRCRVRLRPDGGYPRFVRHQGQRHRVWVRRGRCATCGTSWALLPDFVVAHRADTADTIAAALNGRADPTLPASTVAGWRRRARTNAPALVAGTGASFVAITGTVPTGAASLAALVAGLWLAARARGGPAATPWRLLNAMTGTSWLACRVNSSWARVGLVPVAPRAP